MFVYSCMPALTRILNMPNTRTHAHSHTHVFWHVLMGLLRIRFDVRIENLWLERRTKAKQRSAANHSGSLCSCPCLCPTSTPTPSLSPRQRKLYENNNHCVANGYPTIAPSHIVPHPRPPLCSTIIIAMGVAQTVYVETCAKLFSGLTNLISISCPN